MVATSNKFTDLITNAFFCFFQFSNNLHFAVKFFQRLDIFSKRLRSCSD